MALRALRALPAYRTLDATALEPAGFGGMANDHVRLKGRGLVLRMPRVSQWGLAAHINLAYQATCFHRAAPSDHTPRLEAVLQPSADLPMGALLVEEIYGRKPRLPDDLPAIAECLRRVHGLPLPASADRRPLLSPRSSLDHLLKTIERHAGFLPRAGLPHGSESLLREEIGWGRLFVAEHAGAPEPTTLILTDTHPGNFVVDASGRAYFVDLEKAMYALPAIDLAHATLYTSTRFDPEVDTALSRRDTAAFYAAYLAGIARPLREALGPWLIPIRRLVWLRTMTWCAMWQVESQGSGGWSRQHLDPRSRAHMQACLKDYFDPATIERLRAEWRSGDIEALVP